MPRRKRRRKTRKTKQWAPQLHRVAPMPLWFTTTPYGHCRWCNLPIYQDDGTTLNMRRRWHPDCLHDYLIITRSNYAKRQVKKRDKGVCAVCKVKCRLRHEWECDHVVALADRPDNELKWWKLENLSCLCIDCHAKKSIQENANRRKRKQAEKRRKVDKRKHS
jgi:5-methylcytosine-specific restriction endonuclease McrA